jgi:pyruvate/2-oxoglutarate dehydrogenase complex dihydrolipoamide acyltransferase (E2) component
MAAVAGNAAALQAAAVKNEAGAVTPAGAAAAAAAAAVGQAGTGLAEAAPGTAKSGLVLKQEQQQEQQAAGVQQQQGTMMMSSLGPAVPYDLCDGCCLMLHQACSEATAKAADVRQRAANPQQQQQQQQMAPPAQLLFASLSSHCCGCDQRAATLQCLAPGCSRMFHVPCVQGMGASVLQVRMAT